MGRRTLRGQVAVAGIGETAYYKHGQAPDPEFKLALKAILAAAEDAGIDPTDIDGYREGKSPFLIAVLREVGFSEESLREVEAMNRKPEARLNLPRESRS